MTSQELGQAPFQFLLACLRAASSTSLLAKFLIPLSRGQIIRSDIIPLRLLDSEAVSVAESFAAPLQAYPGEPISLDGNLIKILQAATAGLLLRTHDHDGNVLSLSSTSRLADAELQNRLSSLPWISEAPLSRQRLALVEGTQAFPDRPCTAPSIYLTAQVLGIDLVVLDEPHHWLARNDSPYAHWREGFIPTVLGADDQFANRIVASVQSYDSNKPFDGIITFWEQYQADVSRAAKRLGLPVLAPPESYRIATDKYETSIFAGHDAFRASSAEEAVRMAREKNAEFPLIVKPCKGYSSDGVSRVSNLDELFAAASAINKERHGNAFVVERYCAGPEVDVNFVLLDGEVLFCEVCDDFPKTADDDGKGGGNFHELNSLFPSALPKEEVDLLREGFHEILTRLGFRSGILHLEGRVDGSGVEYRRKEEEDGVVVDLVAAVNGRRAVVSPTPWLIEINPRPPGMKGTQIIESTYGLDYWGIAMVLSLSDAFRSRALSIPFLSGPQYTSVMVFISAEYDDDGDDDLSCKEGIFNSDDVCEELFSRRPDLKRHVSRYGCLLKRGERVPHPSTGVNTFVAYFNVFSRKGGRREALKVAEEVRAEVRVDFC